MEHVKQIIETTPSIHFLLRDMVIHWPNFSGRRDEIINIILTRQFSLQKQGDFLVEHGNFILVIR